MTIGNTLSEKALAGFVGLAMATTFAFAGVATANAQSQNVSDLQQQIQQLQQRLAQLQGGGSSATVAGCSATFTKNLTTGDQGPEVKQVQEFLNNQVDGVSVGQPGTPGGPGNETNYYGQKTASAVTQFQNMFSASILAPVGLSQGTGNWFSSTRAKANSMCQQAKADAGDDEDMDGGPTDGDEDMDEEEDEEESFLQDGEEATIEDFEVDNDPSNEDVDEGEEDKEVMAFEWEQEDANGIVGRVDVSFQAASPNPGTGEDEPWEYLDNVSLWHDGEKIAEKEADSEGDWDDDRDDNNDNTDDHRMRFGGLDVEVEEGDEPRFVVAVSAQNVDDNDLDRGFDVFVRDDGLRVRDGAGVDHEEGNDQDSQNFTIESSEGDLDISSSSNDPEESIVEVNEDTDSGPFHLFSFNMEGEDADIEVEELTVEGSTTNAGADFESIVNDATLKVDGNEFEADVENDGSNGSGTLVFDDDEIDNDELIVAEDEDTEFELHVEFNDQDGNYNNNSDIQFFMEPGRVEAESAAGGDAAQVSGDAESETHTLVATGINTEFVSSDADANNVGGDTSTAERGVYEIKFDVSAFEDDAFIPFNATDNAGAADGDFGVVYALTGDIPFSGTSQTANLDWDGDNNDETGNDNFQIDDGSTDTFTLRVTLDNRGGDNNDFYGVELREVRFNDTDDNASVSTLTRNLDNYETDEISLSN